MIYHIVVYERCDRCGEDGKAIADFTCSPTDGHPEICMDSVRHRLEREGWTFTEREGKYEPWQGKFRALCDECTTRAMTRNIKNE